MSIVARIRTSIVVGVALALAAIFVNFAAPSAEGALVKAKMSNTFVNSIGIVTHLRFLSTPYGNYPAVKARMSELGIKRARDAVPEFTNETVFSRYRDLNASLGVKFMLNTAEGNTLPPIDAETVNRINEMTGPALETLEGANEWNSTNLNGSNPDWGEELKAHQADLFDAVNASQKPDMPVTCPAIWNAPYPPRNQIPVLSNHCDWANMHSPTYGNPPMMGYQSSPPGYSIVLDTHIPTATRMGGTGKPLVASETGYTTARGATNSITKAVHAKYAPRLSFEYFNAGIARGYHYQLVDHRYKGEDDAGSHRAFLDMDFKRKPVFRAMENIIDILEDPGPRFATSSLNYTLANTTPRVHKTLLQKRNGTFYLALWQEVRSYDLRTNQPIAVTPQRVTVRFSSTMKSVRVFDPTNIASSGPTDDAERHPSRTLSSVSSVTEPIGDQVKIIKVIKR